MSQGWVQITAEISHIQPSLTPHNHYCLQMLSIKTETISLNPGRVPGEDNAGEQTNIRLSPYLGLGS